MTPYSPLVDAWNREQQKNERAGLKKSVTDHIGTAMARMLIVEMKSGFAMSAELETLRTNLSFEAWHRQWMEACTQRDIAQNECERWKMLARAFEAALTGAYKEHPPNVPHLDRLEKPKATTA